MWIRKDLKTRAKDVLRGSYWQAFVVSLIIAFVGGNTSGQSFNFTWNSSNTQTQMNSQNEIFPYMILVILGAVGVFLLILAFRIFLGYALEVGGRRFFILAAQNNVDLNSLGYAFEQHKYFNILKTMLWRAFLNFLWYLLLIIPGIVKSYAYRMVPYILADNPNKITFK